jgi:hypothetical protein
VNGGGVKSNAKVWFNGKARLITLLVIGLMLVMSLVVGRWFQSNYVGWLIESVNSPNVLHAQWQEALDQLPQLTHPAVIHVLPSDCLCTLLTIKHAKTVSVKAKSAGFSILQLGSSHTGLGETIEMDVPELSPFIAMTDEQGVLKYLGAYSDGVRCTTANSLVDQFIGDVSNLPSHTIIGLDVKVCRCDSNQ